MVTERIDTVVVGGGQAGLAIGYHLAARGIPFVVLDAQDRVGDAWRHRWDSLRLFTPARFSGLPGSPYPGSPWDFPHHAAFADYLERYAAEHSLRVRTGIRVRRLGRDGGRFVVDTASSSLIADRVVLATGFDARPRVPAFAADVDPSVAQHHCADYRNPAQLPPGDVLVVGAGNSGADIALELAATHRVTLAGRHPGQIPFRIESRTSHLPSLLVFAAFSHVLTIRTPIGRRARSRVQAHSGPLIRVRTRDLADAGVQRTTRITGVRDGMPVTQDGHRLEVASIVWCTGFEPDLSWVDLPGIGADGLVPNERGVCTTEPALYVLGQLFQYSLASSMVHGVGRDAAHLAAHIDAARRDGPHRDLPPAPPPRDPELTRP